jgi:uncharacterized protein (DUF433 family)
VAAPGVCGGRPTFKYTRIDVRHAISLLSGGWTVEAVAQAYKVPVAAVQEALELAAQAPVEERDGPAAASPDSEAELDQKLAELRDDVSNSRVPEARALIRELEARWPESKRVQYWARVLAPPVVVPTTGPDPRSRPRDREHAWLRAHGPEYPGCWLAVFEDRLIAAGPDLGAVLSEARRILGDQTALLHYQPGEPPGA